MFKTPKASPKKGPGGGRGSPPSPPDPDRKFSTLLSKRISRTLGLGSNSRETSETRGGTGTNRRATNPFRVRSSSLPAGPPSPTGDDDSGGGGGPTYGRYDPRRLRYPYSNNCLPPEG
jgi:hypothetical protein